MGHEWIYDRDGTPVGFLQDGSVHDRHGRPQAYVAGEKLYAYDGRHLGWFCDGIFRDPDGYVMGYLPSAQGVPTHSVRSVPPVRPVRGVRPVKSVKAVSRGKPSPRHRWSSSGWPT